LRFVAQHEPSITAKAYNCSDIPAHTYQLSFEPNKKWSHFYASAKEIHQYWKSVVKKYDCMQYIKLGKRVIEARWDADKSKWGLKVNFLPSQTSSYIWEMLTPRTQVEDVVTGTTSTDSCDVLLSATGALNEWKWPKIPGLNDFKGKLLHSANWDEDYDYLVGPIILLSNTVDSDWKSRRMRQWP
jgi:cation diffusion facilitator CzcD-associated flavoprotein CzcO